MGAPFPNDWSFSVVYSDFDVNVHRQLRECALATLKQEEGHLTDRVVKMINWKMVEATKCADWHCIFGTKFSTCLEYDRGSLLHFRIGDHAFVLFRCNAEEVFRISEVGI
nr:unnamed protein product [Haemonchus contortus]